MIPQELETHALLLLRRPRRRCAAFAAADARERPPPALQLTTRQPQQPPAAHGAPLARRRLGLRQRSGDQPLFLLVRLRLRAQIVLPLAPRRLRRLGSLELGREPPRLLEGARCHCRLLLLEQLGRARRRRRTLLPQHGSRRLEPARRGLGLGCPCLQLAHRLEPRCKLRLLARERGAPRGTGAAHVPQLRDLALLQQQRGPRRAVLVAPLAQRRAAPRALCGRAAPRGGDRAALLRDRGVLVARRLLLGREQLAAQLQSRQLLLESGPHRADLAVARGDLRLALGGHRLVPDTCQAISHFAEVQECPPS